MLINLFDVGPIASHTAKQLEQAGHIVVFHEPVERKNHVGHEYVHPRHVSTIGEDVNNARWIQEELTHALQKNRALWLVASASAAVVGRDMLDLCGNSGNIIFCEPPLYGPNKVIGSTLTIERTRQAQQISRIRGRDNSKQYRELEARDDLIDLCRRALSDSNFRDNARIRFKEAIAGGAYLASSCLVAYANYFGFTRVEQPDYVQLVEDFVQRRN